MARKGTTTTYYVLYPNGEYEFFEKHSAQEAMDYAMETYHGEFYPEEQYLVAPAAAFKSFRIKTQMVAEEEE